MRNVHPIKTKSSKSKSNNGSRVSPAPHTQQRARVIQAFGTMTHLPIGLSNDARVHAEGALNAILVDTMVLRDLYQKHHWQVSGPTFYAMHLLFEKHGREQAELVDSLTERVQMMGGLAVATAHDVAERTDIERAPQGREELPAQLSRLLRAHQVILEAARPSARRAAELGDDGTNDLLVSEVVRTNEKQVWFISEHLVDVPLVIAK
jgi:starvation-inducible DNA-binding protein